VETEIRVATPQDHDSILSIMVSVIGTAIDREHQPATIENVKANLAFWRAHPGRCVHLVAESGEIVGVILVKEFWNLCSLFVAPSHQRQGLGRKLVLQAVAACREQSQEPAIYLNAAPGAVAFYTALGFEPRQSAQRLAPGFKAMMFQLAASDA
jgi:GNAT superfamily N-acetyltransferase